MTGTEMECVEKMVTTYIKKTVYGVRADYFRKTMKTYQNEDSIDANMDFQMYSISQPIAVCGHCSGCKNSNLCAALDELTEKQRFIITKIYFGRLTEHEVAKLLGITQQAVHFNKDKALKRLREVMQSPSR